MAYLLTAAPLLSFLMLAGAGCIGLIAYAAGAYRGRQQGYSFGFRRGQFADRAKCEILQAQLARSEHIREIEQQGVSYRIEAILEDADARVAAAKQNNLTEDDAAQLSAMARTLELAAETFAVLDCADHAARARTFADFALGLTTRVPLTQAAEERVAA